MTQMQPAPTEMKGRGKMSRATPGATVPQDGQNG